MGDMDLLRPLGRAGIPCAAVVPASDPARFSRFANCVLEWPAEACGEDRLARLVALARAQHQPPVVFFENDPDLLLISRNRDLLREHARFSLADRELVENLVDKCRFAAVAERLGLPVPRTFSGVSTDAVPSELRFPVMVKPVCRHFGSWFAFEPAAKAIEAATPEALQAVLTRFAQADFDVVVQHLVPGPESRIESYHAYVDDSGDIAGEFTGRKLRTNPVKYGYTTALTVTDSPQIAELGRMVIGRLGLRGVAKLDFKRDPAGNPWLLEVNPRFNLWHHAGAVAGVNIPAIVYADLTGRPRPPISRARPGVSWCLPWRDWAPARAEGAPLRHWLAWTLRCEAKSVVARDDPLPLVRGKLVHRLSRFVKT